MKNDYKLTPSMEDYLESILKMETINDNAKVKDIAKDLKVQMPSVIGALKTLREKKLVLYEKNSRIELTKKGKTIARSVKDRHEAIASFLQKIFIFSEEDAQATACRIEHVIKPETAKQFRNLTYYLSTNIIGKHMSKEEWDEVIQKD
ncbi:MAG: metal-dependent transcriptional regulator [Spirochaetales bacterium]|nr:metal-dependent transcriptional regulator [Spirochaetales bacterium]